MMSCKETARLMSEMKDRDVPLRTRVAVRLHLAMCKMCYVYRKQIETICCLAKAAGDMVMDRPGSACLPADAKERIKKQLSKAD